jgi:phosphonate transport system substrate-binding protein
MSDRERNSGGRTGSQNRTGVSRRRYLALGGAAVTTIATAGCTGGSDGSGDGSSDGGSDGDSDGDSGGDGSGDGNSGGDGDSGSGSTPTPNPATTSGPTDTLEFIETPGNRPSDTRKRWQPFEEYLESEVDGLTVETSFAQNYSATGQALKSGQADMTAGDIIVLADPEAFDIVGIRSEGGSSVYFSFIVSRPTYDGIDELTDLEGESIAFADPLSTSGSLFATYALQQAGLDIGEAPYGDPVDYTANFSNHDAVKQQLFNRADVVAGATYDDNIIDHIPREQVPEIVRERSSAWGETVGTKTPEAKLLNVSDPIPSSPLVVASDWESPLREEIIQACVDIEPGTLRKPEGLERPINNMVAGSIEDYQPVINVIESLDVELGDL